MKNKTIPYQELDRCII